MELWSPNFPEGGRIPGSNAFCVPDPLSRLALSANRNPTLEWSDPPPGTRSFALTCIDHDVPSVGDDVNQEGRVVPADLPRVDFVHWLLADLPADRRRIAEGEFSDGVTPGGKQGSRSQPHEGVNDYTGWFAGDPEMEGVYRGYDGPCPPWNDTIVHHYEFTLYAVDVASLDLRDDYDLADLRRALDGHVLASASLTGTYSLNPDVPA